MLAFKQGFLVPQSVRLLTEPLAAHNVSVSWPEPFPINPALESGGL